MNTYKYAVQNAYTGKRIAAYDSQSSAEMHKEKLKRWLPNIKWEVRKVKQ